MTKLVRERGIGVWESELWVKNMISKMGIWVSLSSSNTPSSHCVTFVTV